MDKIQSVPQHQLSVEKQVTHLLKEQFNSLKKIIPEHCTAERMARIALTAINRVPKLQQCSAYSIVQCVLDASLLGLELNDGTGRAWMVPYAQKAQMIIGYPGLLELAYRSGQVRSIQSYPVFEGDEFEWSLGLHPDIVHKPCGESDPAKMSHVYAVVSLTSGGQLFEVMTRRQVEDIRKRSKVPNNGPWKTDYVEMARKTVLRRVCKIVPMSVELQKAVNIDYEAEFGAIDAEYTEPKPEQVDTESYGDKIDAIRKKAFDKDDENEKM